MAGTLLRGAEAQVSFPPEPLFLSHTYTSLFTTRKEKEHRPVHSNLLGFCMQKMPSRDLFVRRRCWPSSSFSHSRHTPASSCSRIGSKYSHHTGPLKLHTPSPQGLSFHSYDFRRGQLLTHSLSPASSHQVLAARFSFGEGHSRYVYIM